MFSFQEMYANLEHFYWSPEPPETYTIQTSKGPAGLGVLSPKDYGVFNMVWSLRKGQLTTYDEHVEALKFWKPMTLAASALIDNQPISSYATLYTESVFHEWWNDLRYKGVLMGSPVQLIDQMANPIHVQRLPRV